MFCYVQIEMSPLSKSMDEDLAEATKEATKHRYITKFMDTHQIRNSVDTYPLSIQRRKK
jgi:hypothetical protein